MHVMQGLGVHRCYGKNLDGLSLRCNQLQNRSIEKSILLRGSRRIRSCSAISSRFCGLCWLLGLTGLTGVLLLAVLASTKACIKVRISADYHVPFSSQLLLLTVKSRVLTRLV